MYGKIVIKINLEVKTGLHIGGGTAFSAIGAVDSPVIRDPMTNRPIIPGSSLKGKLRTLLSRVLEDGNPKGHNDDRDEIKRLFGSGAQNTIIKSRLQFADAFLSNVDKFDNLSSTEVKFENTINRSTAVATPRQIERVVRGAIFDSCIVYDIENDTELLDDMNNLAKAMRLLQLDYLGGHGTRGSGRVSFKSFDIDVIENDSVKEKNLSDIEKVFKDVAEYELLSV